MHPQRQLFNSLREGYKEENYDGWVPMVGSEQVTEGGESVENRVVQSIIGFDTEGKTAACPTITTIPGIWWCGQEGRQEGRKAVREQRVDAQKRLM